MSEVHQRSTRTVERLRRLLLGQAIYEELTQLATPEFIQSSPSDPESKKLESNATSCDHHDQKLKLDLARQAYGEVLDATKHQDDKVGRFLTAIAFLTTGAVTLAFVGSSSASDLAVRFLIDGDDSGYLLAWSVGLFFFFVIASVILLLLCLSVPVRRPSTRRSLDPTEVAVADDLAGSRIFYSYIGLEPVGQWGARWVGPGVDIRRQMIDQYVKEAHNLSERAKSKYRHTVEAASLFVLALLFLAVALLLKVLVVLDDGAGGVSLERGQIMIVAAISASYAGLQLYTRFVHDKVSVQRAVHFDRKKSAEVRAAALAKGITDVGADPFENLTEGQIWRIKDDARRHARNRAVWLLLLTVPGFSFVLAFADASWSPTVRGLMAGAATVLVWIAMFATRERREEPRPAMDSHSPSSGGELNRRWPTQASRRYGKFRKGVFHVLQGLKVLCVPAVAYAGLFTVGVVHLLAVLSPAIALAGVAVVRQFVTDGASLWRARNFVSST